MSGAKVYGCICQTCAERGVECELVCLTDLDEQCSACLDGHHTVNERGRRMRRFEAELEHPGEAGRQAMEWQGDPPVIR